jgi:RNA polymerase sigma-70 factor (family 1)
MLDGLKTGSHEAFTDIFHHWKQKVYHYFLKKCEQPEVAKDLTQQVFLKLWNYRDQLDEQFSLDQQIFQKARQIYIDWLKKEATYRKHFDGSVQQEEFLENQPALGYDPSLRSSLAAAIASLPEKRKKVFELKHVYGFSYQEIADSMGISVRTVDNQLHKALSHLRKVLSGSEYMLFFFLVCSECFI